MELIIAAVVILGLLFLLGVKVAALLTIVQIIMSVLTSLMLLFFLVCIVILGLLSKKHAAQFAGIKPVENKKDKSDEESSERTAISFARYLVDDEELRNWFPAEGILREKIYARKECFVRIARIGKRKIVFDRHSVVIVVAGTLLMGMLAAGFSAYWLFALGAI